MSHECYMNVTFRFCFRSPLKSLKLPVFKGLSTDLGSHSFLHISFYPLYAYRHPSHGRTNKPSYPSPCHGSGVRYHYCPKACLGCLYNWSALYSCAAYSSMPGIYCCLLAHPRWHLQRKHPTPMTIQLHPQCLLGIQSILRI